MKKTNTTQAKTSWGRVILGALVAYIVFFLIGFLLFLAQNFSITRPDEATLAWILFPLLGFIVLMYSYGVLGLWLFEFEAARNVIVRWAGKILAIVGFFLRPFPIKVFGANKKYLFNLFIVLPLVILGIVCIVLGATGTSIFSTDGDWTTFYYVLGSFAIFNALLALRLKKCPNCGCLMTEIDYATLSYSKEVYTKQYSRNVGYISDGKGNTADVHEIYNVNHEGHANKVAKTFTCKNCGAKRQGRGHTVHEMSTDDYLNRP